MDSVTVFFNLGAPTVRVFTCALCLRRAAWTHNSILFALSHGTVLWFCNVLLLSFPLKFFLNQ